MLKWSGIFAQLRIRDETCVRNKANNAKKEKWTDAKRSDQNSSVNFCDRKAEKSSNVNSALGERTLKRLANLNMYEGRVRMLSRPLGRWSNGKTRRHCRMLSLRWIFSKFVSFVKWPSALTDAEKELGQLPSPTLFFNAAVPGDWCVLYRVRKILLRGQHLWLCMQKLPGT